MQRLLSVILSTSLLLLPLESAWIIRKVATGGGPTLYGNTDNWVWSTQTGYYDTTGASGYCVAMKIDFGSSISGTFTSLKCRANEVDDSSREYVLAVYSHDAVNDRPDTVLATTGRQNTADPGSPTNVEETISKAFTSRQIVWMAFFDERKSNLSTDPRVYYDSATGGETLTLDLASGEWNGDSQEGDLWTDLTNYASAASETWKMQFIIEVTP